MSWTVLFFVCGFVANAALALLALILADRHRRRQQERLDRARRAGDVAAETPGPRRDHPAARMKGVAALDRALAQSGLRLRSGELVVQLAVAGLGLFGLCVVVLQMHPLLALPVSLGLPAAIAALVLRLARGRYVAGFTAELPEALDVFARGLRAGRPVADSLAIVVENAQGPLRREFARCRNEICMGTPLAVSLERLSHRLPTPEVCFFAVATALQAETGGNLIETMESLAQQLRERRKLRRKARALSSEARASAAILASLPFAVGVLLAVLNLSYILPLAEDPRGRVMALAAITSIGLGIFMMTRMGRIDV